MAATKTKSKPKASAKPTKKPTVKKATARKAAPKVTDREQRLADSLSQPAHIKEEIAISDVEALLRDNPSLRQPNNTRRTLPVEEYPYKDPVRKAREKALERVEKAAADLAKAGEDIAGLDPVLDAKIRDARRVLIA